MRSADLLQLIWLASPALPVGGFSYSEGLEAVVEQGVVSSEATAQTWLVDQLHLSLARNDLAVLCLAITAQRASDSGGLAALNQWVIESRETAELRLQSQQMGASLGQWRQSLHGADAQPSAPHTYPVAAALACAHTQADVRDCALAFGFGWAENMVAAAVRAVPLGQTAGQRLLRALAAELDGAVDTAKSLKFDDLQAFTPGLAMLSCQHEHQYSRIFRS